MLEWLEKTRQKPKAVRNQYAFAGAFVLTAVVVSVWAVSVPARFESVVIEGENTPEQSASASGRYIKNVRSNLASALSAEDSPAASSSEEMPATSTELRTATTSGSSSSSVPSLSDEPADVPVYQPRRVLIATTSQAASGSDPLE